MKHTTETNRKGPPMKPDIVNMHPVTSSTIGALGYDPKEKTLYVQFSSMGNPLWSYSGVPYHHFSTMMHGLPDGTPVSIGKYFAEKIKNNKSFTARAVPRADKPADSVAEDAKASVTVLTPSTAELNAKLEAAVRGGEIIPNLNTSKKAQNVATFDIHRDIIDDNPQLVRDILRDVLIIKAENNLYGNSIRYTGYHKAFPLTQPSAPIRYAGADIKAYFSADPADLDNQGIFTEKFVGWIISDRT